MATPVSEITATLPADTGRDVFTPEAVERLAGQRPVLRDPTGYPLGHATVTAAELQDGQIRLTLDVPEHVAARLAPVVGTDGDMTASIGYLAMERTDDERGVPHTHAARLLEVDPIGNPPGACPYRIDHTYYGPLRCHRPAGHGDPELPCVEHEAHVGPGYNDLIRWHTHKPLNMAATLTTRPNRGRCECPPDTRGNACNGTCAPAVPR